LIGYAVYVEKSDPDTVRTHTFNEIVSLVEGVLVLETDKGRREHTMENYQDFGMFPYGPANQPWVN